jgi:trehalose/maltose hydrolase-like predicted phosphorylase
VHLGGGPQAFLEFLEDQLRRRSDVPTVAACDGWSVVVDGEIDPDAERVHDAVLTIAGGMIGTTGAPLLAHPAAQPDVIAAGIYDGEGPTTDLLPAPRWAFLDGVLAPTDRVRRVLDLHSATLGEDVEGKTRLRSLRFASLARPGIVALRADVDPPDASSSPLAPPPAGHAHGDGRGRHWIATHGTGGSVTAAGVQQHDGSRLERLVAYVTGPDGPLPDVAVSRLRDAEDAGFEQLLAEHREAWGARWTRADVRIEGDPLLQRAIRFGLYHMMSSVGDVGEVAMGARGVTGRAYRGHVFWDADLFVLPFLAATHAASARAMLEYRIRRLPAALQRAAGEGRAGARFPWESAGTGFDVTPTAGRDQSGRVVPIRTGEDEVHIVGDVAWATCCYIDWTGDEKFAADVGLELLVETARYWATRIRIDETGHGHIFGVIGPDEYHEPVDDNAYTNVLARWNLRRAADSVERYGHGDVADAEFQSWRDRASSLVDGYDPATNVYEQFAGFFALEPLRIADVAPRRPIAADLLLGRDRVRAAQVVKQPDVLMLHHLLPDELAPGALVPDLDFYDPRTAHGSSLSPGIHASVLARANRIDDAVAALRLAASIDLDDLSESGAGGVHLGAMGSSWQALAFGFMGLAPRRDALRLDPRLPKQWDSLTVNVVYHGTPVCIRVDREAVYVTSSAPLTVDLDDRRLHCDAGETTVSRSQGGNI